MYTDTRYWGIPRYQSILRYRYIPRCRRDNDIGVYNDIGIDPDIGVDPEIGVFLDIEIYMYNLTTMECIESLGPTHVATNGTPAKEWTKYKHVRFRDRLRDCHSRDQHKTRNRIPNIELLLPILRAQSWNMFVLVHDFVGFAVCC